MDLITLAKRIYFLCFISWLPLLAYAENVENADDEEPFVFTAEDKQRMINIADQFSNSSSGVNDKDGNNVDVLGRSNNFFRYDEETTGTLGNQTETMNFSSNSSISTNANQYKSKLVGSGDSSREGRVYKLLNNHRNSIEYKEPATDHKELSDDLTLTDDDPITNPLLNRYLEMDSDAASGVICRDIDPEPTVETRNIISEHFCSKQTGNIYLNTTCSVDRTLITPSVSFPETFIKTEDNNTYSFENDFVGERSFNFTVSEKDHISLDLDLETSSDSVLVTLNDNIVLSYGDVSENPSQFLVDGENTIVISIQDENWNDDEWDYLEGEYYTCTNGSSGIVTRVNGANKAVVCRDQTMSSVLDEEDFESDFNDLDFETITKNFISIPKGYKASGRKSFNSSLIGTIKWNEWNLRTNFFSDIRRQGEMYSTAAIKCSGTRNNGNCLLGVSHAEKEEDSISKMASAISRYEHDGSRTENYGYAILHTNGGSGYPLNYFNFIPSVWQGKTTVKASFTHKKLIESINEVPENCITDNSSVTVQVIGGPVLTGAEGFIIPQVNSSTSPLNLSNDSWECLDSSVARINPGIIPVTINTSDYQFMSEMYPGEKNNPDGVCYKAKARKFLVNINNARPCDDGTWSCYGSDYTATENADNAWLGIVGPNANCRDFETNNECVMQESSCEITNSDTGECTYTGYQYECSKEISTVTPSAGASVQCTTTIPCGAGDNSCNDLVVDESSSFSKTAGILTAANMISQEGDCASDDPNSCILFGGNPKSCRDKVSLVGIGPKDCCENPTDFSTADGIRLALAIASTEYFQSLVAVVYDTITTAATDLFIDLLAEQATDAVVEAGSQAALDAAVNSSASAATSAGTSAGASTAGSAGATAASSSLASSATLQAIGSAVSFVGTVYTAYVIAKALYDIATQCDERDFDAATDLGMGKCLRYDSGCIDRDSFGTCVTHKLKFCCYESAFSKHLNDEIFSKGLGGRTLTDATSCEGLSIDEITNLDWSQITLESWIDELSVSGIIPSTEGVGVGEITESGLVTAGSLSSDEQEEYDQGMAQLKGNGSSMSAEEYFSEENMSDLVGKVLNDPDAATASSNAEEIFEQYDGLKIEDERADTRRELLLDTLYEQYYETCDYEHFSELNYSVQHLQRYVVDEDGVRIDRGECRMYESISKGYMHRFDGCSVSTLGGVYVPNMTRFFNTDDDERITVEVCSAQNFAVTATPCGITHHVSQGYSQSNFILTADSVTSGLYNASSCGYAGLDSVRYPHSVSVCNVQISPPNMLISHQTKVTIDGATETVVACNHDETLPLNYLECGTEHLDNGYRTKYETTYSLNGQIYKNNDCGIKDGISLLQEYTYTECGTELSGDTMFTKYEQKYLVNGVDVIKTSCSIIDGVSEASKLQYESCGFIYEADKKTSQFLEFYLKDGIKVETVSCSTIAGVSVTSDRGTQACGVFVDTATDMVTKSEVYLDQKCNEDENMTETVLAVGSLCTMTYDSMKYSLSYTLGGESHEYNTCDNPLAGIITDRYTKTKGCSWGKKRKNKYHEWSTQGGQVMGTYKKTGSCK